MRAMVLHGRGESLIEERRPDPAPGPGEVLVRVRACGVCRTDLHVVDGELEDGVLPIVPGHEIVGIVERLGPGVESPEPGERVGVPWLATTCGSCPECLGGRENLCPEARFTGFHRDGGYADVVVAEAVSCAKLPPGYEDVEAAPLLCAGLIGYRSLRAAGEAELLGLYGFGAAAHIVAQVAIAEGRRVLAFTRSGDEGAQAFARRLGCEWAGGSEESPPEPLDAAIIFAPVGDLVPAALRAVAPGGGVVCAGIHMSDIPSFPYAILWRERSVRSVANLTRRDAHEFMDLAGRIRLRTETHEMPLGEANEALRRLREGVTEGAEVLVPPKENP